MRIGVGVLLRMRSMPYRYKCKLTPTLTVRPFGAKIGVDVGLTVELEDGGLGSNDANN